MTAGHNDRRLVKIRRRGRHSSPSQVERVAVQAGRAAPAVAIAGALVAVPGAQSAFAAQDTPTTATQTHEAGQTDRAAHAGTESATLDSISTRSVTVASTGNARHAAQVRSSHYTVRGGDSLSKIAQHFYDKAADWGYLYHENAKTVSNPNLIFAGENLYIPASVPADYKLADYYTPKHAAPAPAVTETASVNTSSSSSSSSSSSHHSSGGSTTVVVQSASQGSSGGSSGGLSGTLSCSGLEQLWTSAGGNSADAFMAAEIAEAESGGNQYALSPTDDYGYWQINASNGALATYNAYGNARSAITLSDDGSNWNAWTTYRTGAYEGRC
jgi:Lysozyme like domain/LysM domain